MHNIKKLFPEFYQSILSSEDLSSVYENLIVLDSNYLLDILQLPTSVAKKYIEAIEKVADNIYIPYMVALEFNFKKSKIKKEKIRSINTYKDTLKNSVKKIQESIDKIDLVDKAEKEEFTTELLELTKAYSENLSVLIDKQIGEILTKEEKILYDRLISVIENKIGKPYTKEWIDKIEKEGETRFEEKIPPGFNDITKDEEPNPIRKYGDLKYQRKYGDLIIWKDIIEYSKEQSKKGQKVIFVTNDGKSDKKKDLLYKVSDLTVGPNISLMNELQKEAHKELYILNNLRFVQLVNDLSDKEFDELKNVAETPELTYHKPKILFKSYVNNDKNDSSNTLTPLNTNNSNKDKAQLFSMIFKEYLEYAKNKNNTDNENNNEDDDDDDLIYIE